MSTGQILSVVGMAFSAFGMPYIGVPLMIAGAAVSSQEAIDAREIPKVGDLKSPQFQYGAKLPRLYGVNRTAGTLAWYSTKRVIAGDGGDKDTAPTADRAEIDVLFILAVDSPIIGVTRVWKNGELVQNQNASSGGILAIAEALTSTWYELRFLDGNPEQLPDPVIEAIEGVGNAPAYRHRQCVLIHGLQLGQSGQMPLLEFECVTHATPSTDLSLVKTRILTYFEKGTNATVVSPEDSALGIRLLNYKLFDAQGVNSVGTGWTEIAVTGTGYNNLPLQGITVNGELDLGGVFSPANLPTWAETTVMRDGSIVVPGADGTSPVTIEGYIRFIEMTDPFSFSTPQTLSALRFRPNMSGSGAGAGSLYEFRFNSIGEVYYTDNVGIGHITATVATTSRVHVAMVFAESGFRAYIGGALVLERALEGDLRLPLVPGTLGALQFNHGEVLEGDDTPFGFVEPSAHFAIDEVGVRFAETYTGDRFAPPFRIHQAEIPLLVGAEQIDLSEIVQREWNRVGDIAQIDISDLEGTPVRGFQTGGSVRSALEALAPVFHFGAVASDKLYFRRQGSDPVATIAFDELAAGENQAAAEPFSPERANDEEIPDRVTLSYTNYADNYAVGTESGDRGGVSGAVVSTVQTNVVMIPAEAKAVAETYAAIAGIVATTGQIALTDYYAALEPTDVIVVPDEDGSLYRMRVVRETYGGGVRQLDLVLDDPTALVAPGITSDTSIPSVIVATPPSAVTLLLDIPGFRDADTDPGLYVAIAGG